MGVSMRRCLVVLASVALLVAGSAAAQVCQVCIPEVSTSRGPADSSAAEAVRYAVEQGELQDSLTALGFSHEVAADPNSTACNVYVTYPGSDAWDTVLFDTWVQAGNGLVQISDWGPGIQSNQWLDIGTGYPPQTVTVVDGSHPILTGLPASWTTLGFWHYDPGVTDDYIGWVTDADPNLAQIESNDRGLSARAEGSGRVVYVGWNVYGSAASANDLTVLANAIEWAGQCTVPVELQSLTVD
jgi:hypothetical protein